MIKIIWMIESTLVSAAGFAIEDLLWKIIVVLCGLISLILSITLGGLLKHLHQHNETFRDFRTKEECIRVHLSLKETLDTKLESIKKGIEILTDTIKDSEKDVEQTNPLITGVPITTSDPERGVGG